MADRRGWLVVPRWDRRERQEGKVRSVFCSLARPRNLKEEARETESMRNAEVYSASGGRTLLSTMMSSQCLTSPPSRKQCLCLDGFGHTNSEEDGVENGHDDHGQHRRKGQSKHDDRCHV